MLQNINNLTNTSKSKNNPVFNYYIETYGCQMNVSDSELISSQLKSIGYVETKNIEMAQVILLNTCAIREKAEETVHNRLTSLAYLKKRNPKVIIGIVGCMAQNLKNSILEDKPYVDVILGPDSYRRIPEIINRRESQQNNIVDTKLSKYEVYNDIFPSRSNGVNAWVSIMRGCDKFCTFCIVPFTRGRERSRSIQNILEESRLAVKNGFPEITLLGQNVNSYKTADGGFSVLLDKIAKIKNLKRIRYTSPHPTDLNEDVLFIMRKHKNICNHIHLPLQAGSDNILKRMNRPYTREEFLNLVEQIREYLPDCTLSTDIIVGFPGESDKDFFQTIDVVNKVRFDFAYKFKYSSRPGTKASNYTDHIDEVVKQKRLEKLIEIQQNITLENNKNKIGTVQEILIEKISKKSTDYWAGRTNGNIWTIIPKDNEKIKDVVKVLITDAQGVTLFGEKINDKGIV